MYNEELTNDKELVSEVAEDKILATEKPVKKAPRKAIVPEYVDIIMLCGVKTDSFTYRRDAGYTLSQKELLTIPKSTYRLK